MATQTQVRKRSKDQSDSSSQPTTEAKPSTTSTEVVAQTNVLLDQIDQILAEVEDEIRAHAETKDETKPYTLADAMRDGAAVTNQAIGKWTGKTAGQSGETCALSAAYLAVKARGLA